MADGFQFSDSVQAPGRRAFLIAPHDVDAIDPLPKAVRFDGAGAVTLRTADSSVDVVVNVVAGEVLDWRVQYIRDTGTDAITIHGIA